MTDAALLADMRLPLLGLDMAALEAESFLAEQTTTRPVSE